MTARRMFAGVLVLAVVLVPTASAQKASESKVKATTVSSKVGADGTQTVTIALEIEKGWKVYANPVENEDFAMNATTVVQVSRSGGTLGKIAYPAGTVVKDGTVGDYRVYKDKVELKVTLKDRKGTIKLGVKVQACSDKVCLPPGTVEISVE